MLQWIRQSLLPLSQKILPKKKLPPIINMAQTIAVEVLFPGLKITFANLLKLSCTEPTEIKQTEKREGF